MMVPLDRDLEEDGLVVLPSKIFLTAKHLLLLGAEDERTVLWSRSKQPQIIFSQSIFIIKNSYLLF